MMEMGVAPSMPSLSQIPSAMPPAMSFPPPNFLLQQQRQQVKDDILSIQGLVKKAMDDCFFFIINMFVCEFVKSSRAQNPATKHLCDAMARFRYLILYRSEHARFRFWCCTNII